ncbi:MAG TPA: hypothetical protein VMV78_08785 [Thiobacillus sp.]|nr:hypothetical protein [Thiobacillus sp.]
MANRDIVRGDIGAIERLIEYDSDEERVVKMVGAIPFDSSETELFTSRNPAIVMDIEGVFTAMLNELRELNWHMAILTGETFDSMED